MTSPASLSTITRGIKSRYPQLQNHRLPIKEEDEPRPRPRPLPCPAPTDHARSDARESAGYNLGRSKKAITTDEAGRLWWALPTRPCTTARAEGYDSIQLIEFENGFSFEILDCRGADLPGFDASWDVGCPPPHVELLSGIPPRASRWAPHLEAAPESAEGTVACACDQTMSHINCEAEGMVEAQAEGGTATRHRE